MQTNRDVELRNFYHTQLKNWLRVEHSASGRDVHYPNLIAATLTFKNRVDEITASRTLTYCLNPINRKLFGKNGNKKGKRLKVIPTLETKGNLHYHLLIEIPDGRTPREITELLNYHWKTTINGGYVQTKTKADEGWLDYITKFSRQDDDIDFLNIEF